MMTRVLYPPSLRVALAFLLTFALSACGGAGKNDRDAPPEKGESASAPDPCCPPGEGGEGHGHGEGESSDLDIPVKELLATRCEHEMPTYTCAECRYEVGVAKVPEEMFDPAKGGVFRREAVAVREVGRSIEATGEVRLNEERALLVSPRAPGVVRSLRVDLGARVSAGQVLYEVDSEELRQAKVEFIRARAAHEVAEASEEREREMFERKICPKKDLMEAEAAHRQAGAEEAAARGRLESLGISGAEIEGLSSEGRSLSGTLPVRAPFSGVVLERSLGLGALVQPGDRTLLLADTSTVWVSTDLGEMDVATVLEAQRAGAVTALVRVAAYPGRTFEGTLERTGGTLDETTRTAKARVVVRNPDGLLRAGMFARVSLGVAGGGRGVAVPEKAVMEDAGRHFVFVRVEGDYYIRRPVEVGPASGGWVGVSGGVREGDAVVTDGAFQLKSDVLRSKMGAGCAD